MKLSYPNSGIIETNSVNKLPEQESIDPRYILKCNRCLWNTSYVDETGNLKPSDDSILCPRCRKDLIEVKTQVNTNKETFILPAYLDYVLAD